MTRPRATWVLWVYSETKWWPYCEAKPIECGINGEAILKDFVSCDGHFKDVAYRILPLGRKPK